MSGREALVAAADPALPRGAGDEPVFTAPWQASAFALAVHLYERGLFTWSEWAAALSAALAHQPAEDTGADGYYRAWLQALETLAAEKGVAEPASVTATAEAWQRAAAATPHGRPILLSNDPLLNRTDPS